MASAALAEELLDKHDYCSYEGDCSEVAKSAYSHIFGIPLAAIGLVGFACLIALSLFPESSIGKLLLPLSLVSAASGLALLAIQMLVIGKICELCVVADTSGIALGIIALFPSLRHAPSPSAPWRLGWSIAAGTIAIAPLFWSWAAVEPEPPEEVKAHWIDGKVTIIEISDFDCPACKRANAVVYEILHEYPDIHFVRLISPLPSHVHAVTAGKAYLIAARQGKGEEMAAALFAEDERTPERCRKLAEKLKLDLARYDREFESEEIARELAATAMWTKNVNTAVPLIWVQDEMLSGVPTAEQLREAIHRVEETLIKKKKKR